MLAEFYQETVALTKRWFLQLVRRPATLIVGVVQPLMWLLLFGALFRNVPTEFLGAGQSYIQFLAAGIVVFTAFSGALNAGLPLMFDREFGFLQRILVAPLASRFSIVLASAVFILSLSLIQSAAIILVSALMGATLPNASGLAILALVVGLVVINFTMLSLAVAFALPGHQEMLALIFLVNLPLIFSSTALAPLSVMPTWLQWLASLNPLSLAIEPIRYVYSHPQWQWQAVVLEAPWGDLTLANSLLILLGLGILIAISIRGILRKGIA
ncbi:MAG: ABC transporter permease [Pseudanabaenaceae cyanobacterium SKYG29]|nr:ABC transporter permease [Pseudanabaenaceae cyanobacterium SKYG29]